MRDVWRTTIIGVPDDEEITREMLNEDKLDQEKMNDLLENAEHQHSVEHRRRCDDPDYSYDGTEIEIQDSQPAEGKDAERKLMMSSKLILTQRGLRRRAWRQRRKSLEAGLRALGGIALVARAALRGLNPKTL